MDTYDYRQDTDSINETQAKIDLLSGRSFFMQKFIGGSTAQVNQKLIFTKRCNSKH